MYRHPNDIIAFWTSEKLNIMGRDKSVPLRTRESPKTQLKAQKIVELINAALSLTRINR